MNKKDFVTLEVAKLLKEKNFNKDYNAYYDKDGLFIFPYRYMEIEYLEDGTFPTYTLYEVQKWLREKYNCYIQVTHEAYKTGINYLVQVLFYEPNNDDCWSNESTGVYGDNAEFNTYEDALNFGILEALKRI